jgi:saccharopine dehydrogenase-like NADP-dependent oxidoreductase
MDAYRADSLSKGRMNVDTKMLDATNEDQLGKIIYSHDIVVSLVPAKFHPLVAK